MKSEIIPLDLQTKAYAEAAFAYKYPSIKINSVVPFVHSFLMYLDEEVPEDYVNEDPVKENQFYVGYVYDLQQDVSQYHIFGFEELATYLNRIDPNGPEMHELNYHGFLLTVDNLTNPGDSVIPPVDEPDLFETSSVDIIVTEFSNGNKYAIISPRNMPANAYAMWDEINVSETEAYHIVSGSLPLSFEIDFYDENDEIKKTSTVIVNELVTIPIPVYVSRTSNTITFDMPEVIPAYGIVQFGVKIASGNTLQERTWNHYSAWTVRKTIGAISGVNSIYLTMEMMVRNAGIQTTIPVDLGLVYSIPAYEEPSTLPTITVYNNSFQAKLVRLSTSVDTEGQAILIPQQQSRDFDEIDISEEIEIFVEAMLSNCAATQNGSGLVVRTEGPGAYVVELNNDTDAVSINVY